MDATNTASSTYAVSAMTSAGVALADGDSVSQCSTLTITTTPPIQQGVNYVMESTLGKFTDPYVYPQYVCEYSRTNNQAGVPLTHTLYLTKSGPASIYFGWAVADSTVYISPSLALTVTPSATGNCSTGAPTAHPTVSPTGAPIRPTITPTIATTAPTLAPTRGPTPPPSLVPSSAPATAAADTAAATAMPNAIIGGVVGSVGGIVLVLGVLYYCSRVSATSKGDDGMLAAQKAVETHKSTHISMGRLYEMDTNILSSPIRKGLDDA
ncbi:unnamed protein product [Sphagnum jensenii]|uniref:Uncharacterized protein n=1 Tax=Sphagnum jensenii TaxID=128206 RepID=A0ABP0V980_9BRYO